MSARHALALLLVAAPLAAGCAVGRAIVGAPPAGANAVTSAPAAAAAPNAHMLLARRCVGCHAVPEPAKMTAAEWDAGLTLMKKRLRLPDAEWDSLAAMRALTRAR